MKFIYFFAAIWIVSLSCNIKTKTNLNQSMIKYDFDQAWNKVEILEKQGLSKTAFKKVNEIYIEAKKTNQNEHLFKTVFYKGKYYMTVEEDGLIKTITEFQKEALNAKQPEKSVFQSILAELYDRYLSQNLWKINQRSTIIDSEDNDIRNWSAKQFIEKSTKLYLASVENDQLENILLDDIPSLFSNSKNTTLLRKTLYDILAHRAIEYFKDPKSYIPRSMGQVVFNDENLFSEASSFVDLNFDKFELSQEIKALILFQDLLKKYLKDKNKAEILDLELNRLRFIKRSFVSGKTDQLYEFALKNLISKYEDQSGVAEAKYYLASYYYGLGQNNNTFESKEKKWKIKEAFSICLTTIQNYPNTYGADQCKALVSQIERKTLRIKTEQVNLPGENIISLIEYQNLSKVFFKLISLDKKTYRELASKRTNEISAYIKNFPVIKSWSLEFPGSEDYRIHSSEISIDALDLGAYVLVASDNSEFNYEDPGHWNFPVLKTTEFIVQKFLLMPWI